MKSGPSGSELGVVLMEVLVALVVLSATALGALAYLSQFALTQQTFQLAESELIEAEQVLTATLLLTREELDQRLGGRVLGNHLVSVLRPEAHVYRVAVSRVDDPTRELLVTVLYRREDRSGRAGS